MNIAYLLSFTASFLQALFTPTLVIYAYTASISELEISFIVGFSSMVYIVGALASARLYASLGSRKVVLLSLLLLAVGLSAHVFTSSFWGILAAASTTLLGFGIFWPAIEAYLSHSGSNVSKFSFSWSSGSLVGALVTSTLLRLNLKLLFLGYAAVALLHAVSSAKLEAVEVESKTSERQDNSVKALLLMIAPWLYCLAYSASAAGIFTFYPIFVEAHNLSKDNISLVNFSMLLARTFTFFFFDRIPAMGRNPLISSILFLSAGELTMTSNVFLLAVFSAFIGYAQGVVYATGLEMVFKRGHGVEKATALFESFIGLGYALAPPLSGAVNASLGFEPISFSSLLSLLCTILAIILVRKR